MGQQHRKVVKRSRRKAYLERKKTRAKQGITRRASRTAKAAEGDTPKKVAKKPAAKKVAKAPAAKKAAKPAAESTE